MLPFRLLSLPQALLLLVCLALAAPRPASAGEPLRPRLEDTAAKPGARGPTPATALLLGLMLPGCGHAYVGRPGTGILLFLICSANCIGVFVIATLMLSLISLSWLALLTAVAIHCCLGIFDGLRAYTIAQRNLEKWPDQPRDPRLQGEELEARLVPAEPFGLPQRPVSLAVIP